MKNKRLLYVLLPAVLAIWGLIFQRIWSAAAGSPEEPASDALVRPLPMGLAARSKPPTLLLNYSDPFKGDRAQALSPPTASFASPGRSVTSAQSSALNLSVAAPAAVVPPVVWPAVKYLGFINNPRQNSRIALIAIDEKEAMFKVGDSRQGVRVAKISRDSVQLSFQGKRKSIGLTTQ